MVYDGESHDIHLHLQGSKLAPAPSVPVQVETRLKDA